MRDIEHLVIHCSDSPQGRGDNAATIHRWHTEKGWDGIGYHYVILESGEVEAGRPEYWPGAHARGHNKSSIGICLIGKGVYTIKQFKALDLLLLRLKERHPDAKVVGHDELDSYKDCPCFDVQEWLKGTKIGLNQKIKKIYSGDCKAE